MQALQAKLGLEARRVAELEGLIARLRASQFRSQTDGQMAGNRTDGLSRRNAQLEEEVRPSACMIAPQAAGQHGGPWLGHART